MGRGTARKYLASVEWLRDAKLATMAECVNVALRLCAVRCPLHFKKVGNGLLKFARELE